MFVKIMDFNQEANTFTLFNGNALIEMRVALFEIVARQALFIIIDDEAAPGERLISSSEWRVHSPQDQSEVISILEMNKAFDFIREAQQRAGEVDLMCAKIVATGNEHCMQISIWGFNCSKEIVIPFTWEAPSEEQLVEVAMALHAHRVGVVMDYDNHDGAVVVEQWIAKLKEDYSK